MKKIILIGVIAILMLTGCTQEKIVYVDLNGSIIPTKKHYNTLDFNIVCDQNGYAYYQYGTSLAPVLVNKIYGTYITKCSDL